MALSHAEVARRFSQGATKGSGCHMFIEGDTMYSYGHWFPLVIRREWGFLLNADKRSVSTSQHQGHCRGFATIAVPFSAIDAAGLDPYAFSLVDKSEPRIDTRTYRDDKGETHTVEERRPESAVIRFGKRYFLSGMDSDRYFISELPYAVKTCAEAYDALVPAEVRGKDYVRQGEWFAIPAETIPASLLWSDARGFYRHMERGFDTSLCTAVCALPPSATPLPSCQTSAMRARAMPA